MKFTATFAALVAAVVAVEASNVHVDAARGALSGRHARLSRRTSPMGKRCRARPSSSAALSSPSPSTSTTSTTTWVPPTSAAPTSSAPAVEQLAAAIVNTSSSAVSGLINVVSNCGAIGATTDITSNSGPNGAIWWLNCGLDGSGWNPPFIQVSDLVAADLSEAIQDPNSPFQACAPYVSLFEQYAAQHNIPAILLASFAMQESTCNPATVGGAGEQGLMQLTKDKCGNAPNGNCQEPWYNIMTGAQFFADTLNGNGGDFLKTVGQYNGWQVGMTVGQATAAASTSCCRCQNNLDYLFQFVNGWLQNVNAYTTRPRLGQYFNLDQCS